MKTAITATLDFVDLYIIPRATLSWKEFVKSFPGPAIALDGTVKGGPRSDQSTLHFNYDHHENVVREATMSTVRQILFAIKGGLMGYIFSRSKRISVVINDIDQDTILSLWLILNWKIFEKKSGIPNINRLISITDQLDITGGAYPVSLDERVTRQHNWVFYPYMDMRISGRLAIANETAMLETAESIIYRLDKFKMGQSEELELDIKHEIFFNNDQFTIYNELGTEARYWLFNHGMQAFIAQIAKRPDSKIIYSIGRIQYTHFPMLEIYDAFNKAEETKEKPWGGSNLIGGSRNLGSTLSWQQLRDILLKLLN